VKSQSQRDLERHWADQSKKLTPAERFAMKAEKLRKRIERDKAFLERRKQESQDPVSQTAVQGGASGSEATASSNSKASGSPRRRAKE